MSRNSKSAGLKKRRGRLERWKPASIVWRKADAALAVYLRLNGLMPSTAQRKE
jgi:hypothetical protein